MESDIKKCLEILESGGIILYPTDTIWGLGCDATNEKAVARIFEIKKRNESKSLVVLVESEGRLQKHVKDIPEVAWEIIDASEKPITIIYDKAVGLAPNVQAKDGSIAIRLTKDPFCRKLIQRLKKPIVSTSANFAGQPSPDTFANIDDELLEKADHRVLYRQSETNGNQPSSIIKVGAGGLIKIIRE